MNGGHQQAQEPTPITTGEASGPDKKSETNGNTNLTNDTNGNTKITPETKHEKLSGAEIKKRAKAEKAARRAQSKQEKQPLAKGHITEQTRPPATIIPGKDVPRGSASGPPTLPTSNSKVQHKRTGSMNASSQKAIPLRPTQPQSTSTSVEPQKENKKVALFGHLYGHPRRTTLAGAGKDVHPAVLALGLQMSNYVVCGSNARCIATMLIFKRVRTR